MVGPKSNLAAVCAPGLFQADISGETRSFQERTADGEYPKGPVSVAELARFVQEAHFLSPGMVL